jgi:putative spermidine/putrescine transport system substrate-binding protein
MSKTNWSPTRRDALKSLGLAAGVTALPFGSKRAWAQSGGRVVVGTWGGDYARLLAKNVEDPLLKPKGYEVLQARSPSGACRVARATSRASPPPTCTK